MRNPIEAVALPTRDDTGAGAEAISQEQGQADEPHEPPSETSTIAAPSEPETPATSQAPSESDFTQVSTPATPAQAPESPPKTTPTQTHQRKDTRTAIAVPNIPGLPKPKASPPAAERTQASPSSSAGDAVTPTPDAQTSTALAEVTHAEESTPPPKPTPKSWADLVRTKGAGNTPQTNGTVVANGVSLPKSASLADALRQYSVQNDAPLNFLEPRGLVNTGNMCYTNSVSMTHR